MTHILILLILLLIMISLHLFITKEGFVSTPLKSETIDAYNKFLVFYNTFCANWKKAIQGGVALELPQQPAASPSQFNSTATPSAAPSISDDDMNQYITKLSQQLSQSLPPTCTTFPAIDSDSLQTIIKQIPSVEPYMNALNWMNEQMEKSHASLGSALTIEGFDNNDTCQNLSACLSNNPELAKQIATEMSSQNVIETSKLEDILVIKIAPFLTSADILDALTKNTELVKKSQEIQAKAESGELINNINGKSTNLPEIKYNKPAAADKLINMKKSDPERYKEIDKSYGQWISIKNLTDQINATL